MTIHLNTVTSPAPSVSDDAPMPAFLSPEEWRVVLALREVPPSRLRSELCSLVDDLLAFAREPRCPDSQADGVPCASARLACDECERVMTCLRLMRTLVGCA